MSKASTLEPVAVVASDFDLLWAGSGPIAIHVERHGVIVGSRLVTIEQAEAYAAAKVREALEEALAILKGMYTAEIQAREPEGEENEEGWNLSRLERALALTNAAIKVRALLPSTPAQLG